MRWCKECKSMKRDNEFQRRWDKCERCCFLSAAGHLAGTTAVKTFCENTAQEAFKQAALEAVSSPWQVAAVAAEYGTYWALNAAGETKKTAHEASSVVGLGASMIVGGLAGGPVGVAVSAGAWVIGHVITNPGV